MNQKDEVEKLATIFKKMVDQNREAFFDAMAEIIDQEAQPHEARQIENQAGYTIDKYNSEQEQKQKDKKVFIRKGLALKRQIDDSLVLTEYFTLPTGRSASHSINKMLRKEPEKVLPLKVYRYSEAVRDYLEENPDLKEMLENREFNA